MGSIIIPWSIIGTHKVGGTHSLYEWEGPTPIRWEGPDHFVIMGTYNWTTI